MSGPAGLPQSPHDLADHQCINLRFPTLGGLYAWEFERNRRPLNIRVDGRLIVNTIALARAGAIGGVGIAFLPEDFVQPQLEAGTLRRVLEDWCAPFPGYHLYYPSSRQQSPALAVLAQTLLHRT